MYFDANTLDNRRELHDTPFVGIIVVRMLAVILSDGVVERQKTAPQLRGFHSAAGGNERTVILRTLKEIKVKHQKILRLRMVESGTNETPAQMKLRHKLNSGTN